MTFQTSFVPSSQVIASITNSNPTVVTTVANHGYLTGLLVRLTYPVNFGMPQINKQFFPITVLSENSFSIPVNSIPFDPFIIPNTLQVPQVIPMAEVASILTMAEINNRNIIPET